MGRRGTIKTTIDEPKSTNEIIHEEKRINDIPVSNNRRANNDETKRIAIWVKESTLEYEADLKELQIEMLKFQNHVKNKGLKVLFIFEGRDAAGKGGTIKRLTEHLNPRGARIVALEKPSDVERTQWYFQRYVRHLPSAGEMVFFDRSWYNRGGVEPVMGYCSPKEHEEFLKEVSAFEKMLINSGIILFKFYFSVTKKAQSERFAERIQDPLKQFKISPVDLKAQGLWQEYSDAKLKMLKASHTEFSPWTIIRSDDKKKARINCFKHILNNVSYAKKRRKKFKIDHKILLNGGLEIIRMENNSLKITQSNPKIKPAA